MLMIEIQIFKIKTILLQIKMVLENHIFHKTIKASQVHIMPTIIIKGHLIMQMDLESLILQIKANKMVLIQALVHKTGL